MPSTGVYIKMDCLKIYSVSRLKSAPFVYFVNQLLFKENLKRKQG